MLPATWQRINSKAANYSNAFNSSSILGSRKSSLSSLSLASFASSDTSFTAVSYTSHHYQTATASNTSRISINGDSSVISTKNTQQQQVLPNSASEVVDDDYDDLDDAGSCGGDGRIYGKLDCVIEENL